MISEPERGPSIIIGGAVESTLRTLQALVRHRMDVIGVLGLDETKSANVSAYVPLEDAARSAQIDYLPFKNINDPEVVEWVQSKRPDLLMVIGLSQLVKSELMSIPKIGTVGFHPTYLPKGRGRAPVAWLTHDGGWGASTFFAIDDGIDSGPILAQQKFYVESEDDAGDVATKLLNAIDGALDTWLPRLRNGDWSPVPQDASQATYNGKRDKVDGLIDWSEPSDAICRKVRVAARPHPGAYTFHRGEILTIWRAHNVPNPIHRGVVGRILEFEEDGSFLVQTGDGLVQVLEFEIGPGSRLPRVGELLGFAVQQEVYELRNRIRALESQLLELKSKLQDLPGGLV